MNTSKMNLKNEVKHLAEEAFALKLISGYGEGEYYDKYQIVYEGKPRHLPLERARSFLKDLIKNGHHHETLLKI